MLSETSNAVVNNSPGRVNHRSKGRGPFQRGRKVSFADENGKQLCNFTAGQTTDESSTKGPEKVRLKQTKSTKALWSLAFPPPELGADQYWKRVNAKSVCLDCVQLTNETLKGTIKSRSRGSEKLVFVRYSTNQWVSFSDHAAKFKESLAHNCCAYDVFEFEIPLPKNAIPGQRISLCIGYRCAGREYWDNNNGQNYSLVNSNGASDKTVNLQANLFR